MFMLMTITYTDPSRKPTLRNVIDGVTHLTNGYDVTYKTDGVTFTAKSWFVGINKRQSLVLNILQRYS